MPTPLTLTGPVARELLMECCVLLSRDEAGNIEDEDFSAYECLLRAELIVREAVDRLGEDYENPSLLGVLKVADIIARERAESHPEFAAQVKQLASLINQHITCR